MSRTPLVSRRIHLAIAAFAVLVAGGCADDGTSLEPDAPTSEEASIEEQMAAILKKHPNATQLSDHEIAFDDGNAVLDLRGVDPDAPQDKATVHGCPSGWYCFYQHQNFGGRKLQFKDCTKGGTSQWLSNYGFENQTTSWVVNRGLNFINVNDDDASPGYPKGRNLWNADGNSQSSNVGTSNNDKADWFICYS